MFVSIVIPVHNEAHRLRGAVETVCAFLKAQAWEAEVIVVDNGSTDGTFDVARACEGVRAMRRGSTGSCATWIFPCRWRSWGNSCRRRWRPRTWRSGRARPPGPT
ncbi:MAG: glycosyltransferase [Planctomycetota bacterium]|nr:glycosyltransferase [Planctomycetota bacterium]